MCSHFKQTSGIDPSSAFPGPQPTEVYIHWWLTQATQSPRNILKQDPVFDSIPSCLCGHPSSPCQCKGVSVTCADETTCFSPLLPWEDWSPAVLYVSSIPTLMTNLHNAELLLRVQIWHTNLPPTLLCLRTAQGSSLTLNAAFLAEVTGIDSC